MKHLIDELLIRGQDVMCGTKLIAEIHYIYPEIPFIDNIEDISIIDETLKHWPDLNYYISYHPDEKAAKEGHKSVIIYKYSVISQLMREIELLDKNSLLYHFCLGKLFGYNDYEVMKFLQEHLNDNKKDDHN